MGSSNLIALLDRLRRRLLMVGGAEGAGWGLAAALGVLAAAVWLDLMVELPPLLRIAAWLAAASGAGLLIARAVVRITRGGTPRSLARRLDQAAESHGQIAAGVDLLLAPAADASDLGRGLADLAVERAAGLAGQVSAPAIVPLRPLRRSLGTLAGLAAGLLLLALLMPRLVHTQWLRFTDPFGDHPPYSRVEFQVRPGDVQVVYGRGLEIEVTAIGPPVEQLDLVLRCGEGQPEETLPMFPEAGGTWRASLASLTESLRYLVRADGARSQAFRIEIITVPKLEDVRFRVTPPAYTNRPAYEGPLPQGGLAGLPGAKVQVWAHSNRPLSAGALATTTPEGPVTHQLKPTPPGADEVTGFFEIRHGGQFELHVTDVAGQPSTDRFAGSIHVLRDERPFVRLIEPKEMSFAIPDVTLPVVLAAEDDYGVSRVQLFRSLNDSRPLPLELPVGTPAPTRWNEGVGLPLSSYQLAPGDVLKFFARVEDNDPAGTKGSESPIATVHIIAREEYERLLRTRQGLDVLASKYQAAQRRIEALAEELRKQAEELKKLPPDSELAAEKKRELEKLTRQMRDEAEAIRQSAQRDLPYDLDQELKKELETLAESLDNATEQAEQLSDKQGRTARQAAEKLEELARQLKQDQGEFEKQATEPLDQLTQVYPLIEDQERFVELTQRQRDLADRMASLKGHDNEDDPARKARMRDLENEQRGLRQELNKLVDDIQEHVAKLPDDEQFDELRKSASDFARECRNCGAAESMSQGEAGLAEFSGTQGHAGAEQAAKALEGLCAKCQGGDGMGQQAGQCLRFNPTLGKGLGNTIDQLLADAGLKPGGKPGSKPGMSQGQGSGGGYSADRSRLKNTGLYGDLPTSATLSKQGDGQGPPGVAGHGGANDNGGPDNSNAVSIAEDLKASGAASPVVPSAYRRRVADYFERIADETE